MITTQQPNLFGAPNVYGDFQPLPSIAAPITAHRRDPATSQEAAERVAKSGRRQRNRAIALALVKAMPGLTGHELWARAGDDDRSQLANFNELYRVLADLKNRGMVSQGEPRPCAIRGTKMVVWQPV